MRGLIVAAVVGLVAIGGEAGAEDLFKKSGITPPPHAKEAQEFAASLVRCAAIARIAYDLEEEKSPEFDEVEISAIQFLAAATYWDYLMSFDGKAKSLERIETNFVAQVGYWAAHYSMSAENPRILTKTIDAIDECGDLRLVRDSLVNAAELAGFGRAFGQE